MGLDAEILKLVYEFDAEVVFFHNFNKNRLDYFADLIQSNENI